MITYPISSSFCKKIPCNVICFTIYHFLETATGGVLLNDVLKNVTKFTGKHLLQSLFFNKVAGEGDCF